MKLKNFFIYFTTILVALGAALCLSACNGGQKSYYQIKVEQFQEENPSCETGQIVFIGDSITDLYPLQNYYSELPLKTYNRGIGGDTTTGLLQRMQVSLYDIAPSKIVIMIGVNDIDGGVNNNKIIQNYTSILQGIKNNLPNTEVYVMSDTSQHSKLQELAKIDISKTIPQIMQLNTRIKSLAEEMGYTYLDLFSLTVDKNNHLKTEYSDDGIHLNAAGFSVWTNLVIPYLT